VTSPASWQAAWVLPPQWSRRRIGGATIPYGMTGLEGSGRNGAADRSAERPQNDSTAF
jgi:hypothetical protein